MTIDNIPEEKSNDDDLDVYFIANAGVKDIVGRGLIYNDNVALIELVKNSKDADSPTVILDFKNPRLNDLNLFGEEKEKDKPKLIIKDFGKGMSRKEIKDKWLNIAYSEKKHNNDKKYAGNKGVGRFSCDRLGKVLDLYTKSNDDTFLHLSIDWTLFENKGQNDQISSIPLRINEISEINFLNAIEETSFEHGTVLKISELRTHWPENKLKKLITELEKFSPSMDESFSVYFNSNGDFKDKNLILKINQKINNTILDKLVFKTTYIKSTIDPNGKYINTELYFQSEKIYSYKAVNPYSNLKNISAEIHYLDTISKAYFTKHIGVRSVEYGSIFLFYNGFRISPYGNPKNDWLNLDQRKSQGTSRNLGTREVFGRIDIVDNSDDFSVITSREGLAQDDAYLDLVASDEKEKTILRNKKEEYGFVTLIIRQLESFVVNGLNWNRLIDKLDDKKIVTLDNINKDPERFISKTISSQQVIDVLEKILKSNIEVVNVEINKAIIKKIQKINEQKFESYKSEFIKKIEDKSLEDLSPNEKGSVKKIIERETIQKEAALEDKELAEKEAQQALEKRKLAEKEAQQALIDLRAAQETNRYLIDSNKILSPDAAGLIHTIKLTNSKVKTITSNLLDDVVSDSINKEYFIENLSKILLNAEKALKMAQLATKADVDKNIDNKFINFPSFIKDYSLSQIDTYSSPLNIEFSNCPDIEGKIDVLSLSIVLDNLISNSEKWGAKEIFIEFELVTPKKVKVIFSDNGLGVSERFIKIPDTLFELGTRDTPVIFSSGGSGIGLYNVRENLKQMNATIKFIGNNLKLKGASFEMEFCL